jgi:hypothetical protein
MLFTLRRRSQVSLFLARVGRTCTLDRRVNESKNVARVGCPRTLPRSKHLNISYEREFGAYSANQEIDVATQHNICASNQDTAERSKLLCSQ